MTLGASSFDASRWRVSPESQDSSPGADHTSAIGATTKRVLLGNLQIEDASSAVARRLRTAIGLGVLAHGEKLPKEADLARQFGVAAFSLREALGTLRSEGLIVTRVGKFGGSYVEQPPPRESMAGEELVRLTASELRDLGDWRATLTTYAAWLAAHRRSDATGVQLAAYVQEMVTSDNPVSARRALGRFHVELSAGSQSMRLTRAELMVHEEFDWLAQVLLRDETHRVAIAELMRTITTHVRAGEPSAAWEAGEHMVSYVLTELTKARLQIIATRHAHPRRANGGGAADLAEELRLIFERTVKLLEDVGEGVSGIFATSPTSGELNVEVARYVFPCLVTLDEIVHGLGFMAEVGILPEVRYWLEWWQRAADGTFDRDYSHQLDPTRDDFYDYGSKIYLTQPRDTGEVCAMGPYVDHGGVDDYLVTVAVPVTHNASFVGIMAADIPVASLERAVSPWLAQAEGPCVVLNAESRVVLSNSVRYNVGDVLPGDVDLTLDDVGCFGWFIGRVTDDSGLPATRRSVVGARSAEILGSGLATDGSAGSP